MNRRKFILASGTAILTGTSLSATQRPAAGLEFELSTTPNKDPQSVNSVIVDFSKFELTPQYLDSSNDLTVQITVSLDGIDSKQFQSNIQVKQDIDRTDMSSELPLVIDGINTSQDSIDGEIEVIVSHPDLNSQTYRQSFNINNSRIGVIDDFEDGDLSEYTTGTGGYTVQTNTVYEGTYALECNNSNFTIMGSRSGHPRYPQAGDSVQCQIRLNDSVHNMLFLMGFQDTSNYYSVVVSGGGNNEFRLDVTEDGNRTTLTKDGNVSHSYNEWLRVEVDWGEGGSFEGRIYDEAGNQYGSWSVTDATFSDGGIAFSGDDGGTSIGPMADSYKITKTTPFTGVIDDFEDANLSGYSGDTGEFSFVSSSPMPYEGSYCLRTSSDNKTIESYSGLPRYPQVGDTFQYRVQIADSSADGAGFRFGRQDSNNQYLIRYGRDGNGYRFDSMNGGNNTILAQDDSTPLLENEWVQVKVDWKTNGDFTITFYDESGSQITQLNATDSTYKGGGIAFTTAGSTSGYVQQAWDTLEIINSEI